MAQEQNQGYDQFNAFISDLNLKLRDLEEKNNLSRDRIMLIGETFVNERQEINNEVAELKKRINEIETNIKKIKMFIERFLEDSSNFIRKNEFQILKRQFELFQPLDLARISDVEAIVEEKLKKALKG